MNSSVVVAVGIAATVVAIVGYIGYRRQEGARLDREAALASRLRELAGGDPVRLAAVDEFETRIYQRLFGVSTVSPRVTAAAWAFLGAVLSTVGLLATKPLEGALYDAVFYLLIAFAVIFAIAFLVLLVLAVYAATSLPRISFEDAYVDEPDATSVEPGSPGTAAAD
ncbi:hypothetical protein [Williamsia phyllosphaerae]|uniref:hypothetical protein n=1 Tax=Williamsia phyllosphaerae TaxID=885042 RepID=UPI001E5BC148|nr:hypothetical protein [Williamsia phyllosphaerae]